MHVFIKALLSFLVAAAVLLITGCVSSRPHQTSLAPRPALDGRLPGPAPIETKKVCPREDACVAFVEYDDFGNPFNRGQLLGAVQLAQDVAAKNGSVLVFVHGWHNDAADGTRDVEEFKALVARASDLDKKYRPRQPEAGKLLGIYVGWRGDSIASSGWTKPLSYLLTFWDRKNAAHQIGNSGGVYELFSRLAAIRRTHEHSRLLIHGHSFGGAVVFSASGSTLVDQMMLDAANSQQKAPSGADLVLLINPAFEAMKLRPPFDLARSQEYQPALPPRLVILTTEADWATGVTFPLGRRLGTIPAAYADEQSPAENVTAVGHHLPMVTHQLALALPKDCPQTQDRIALSTPPAASPKQDNAPMESLSAIQDPAGSTLCIPPTVFADAPPLLLRRCDQPGDCAAVADQHFISRGPVAQGHVPYRLPIMNIRTTSEVSAGHSDIRTKALENFVVQLLALAIQNPGTVPSAPPESPAKK
jgi:hypothetical protein